MKKLIYFLAILLSGHIASAHVGSSGVQMQGQAGPYKVLVSIQPPDVIPGTALISVFIESGTARKVSGRPIYFRSGDEGAPSPDDLPAVAGQSGQFQGQVWLMESGSSSVQIQIDGAEGKGELVVPVMAMSTAQREMPEGLGIGLGILGTLLFLLMITTIGASVSDGLLPAGVVLSPSQRRKRWMNMGIAAVVCALFLYAGSSWWDAWAANYKRYIYKPVQAQTKISVKDNQRLFELNIDTTDWHSEKRGTMLSTLIPDHGKLMHTFLIRIPGLDAFAHIHPERKDTASFEAYLPELPAGKYLVYADLVRYSGFAETIVDTLVIPEPVSNAVNLKSTSEEDAYVITDPIDEPGKVAMAENVVICGKPGTKTVFKDGSYAVWEGKPDQALEAGKPYQLKFNIFNPDGSPCLPEPYLGMLGHVAVVRTDGSVYIHLHPTGTFAMAAEQIFKDRISDTTKLMKKPSPGIFKDSVDRYLAKLKLLPVAEREQFLMTEMGMYASNGTSMNGMEHTNEVSFPYSFPKDGRYRIFLQIKRNDKVLTGVFDVKVKAPLM